MENPAFDVAALLAPPDILKSKCALCIQPHPDDNEIGMGGTIAALAARGKALTIRVKEGDTIVRVDPRYFRPTEVETLLGDPAKAQAKLGWAPRTTFEEMVQEMARHDLELALRDAVVEDAGFTSFKHEE